MEFIKLLSYQNTSDTSESTLEMFKKNVMFASSIHIQKICFQHFLLTLYAGEGTTLNVGFSSNVMTNVFQVCLYAVSNKPWLGFPQL
jgi:hypothetical protein